MNDVNTMCDRLDAIYDRLQGLADNLTSDLSANTISRRVTKAEVNESIQRLIGARMLLVMDEGSTRDQPQPAWVASSRALDKAKQFGFTWK